MTTAAVIFEGVVVSMELVGEDWVPPAGHQHVLNPPEGVTTGWLYSGGQFSAPPAPEPPAEPHRVSRIDFVRLFRVEQQMAVNALRKRVAALQPEDYTSPDHQLLVMLEVVLQQFDLPDEFIELDHSDTATGLGLLAIAGVFGEGDSSAEVARIIRGERPTY